MSFCFFLTLIIQIFAQPVHAGNEPKNKSELACYEEMSRPGTFHADSFSRLVAFMVSLKGKADESTYVERLAELLGFADGTHGPVMKIRREKTSDYMDHFATVVIDEAASPKSRPTAVIFRTDIGIPKFADEGFYFRVNPDGTLEKAFAVPGKRDEQDQVIEGSGRPVILDVNDPETRYRFQHEMDFWLKGVFLRPTTVHQVARKGNNGDSQTVKDAPASKTSQ